MPKLPPTPAATTVFPTRLGWMALLTIGKTLRQLTFGHASARAALAALDRTLSQNAQPGEPNSRLAKRLTKYIDGSADDFADVPVDFGPASPFRRRVMAACRAIPYGQTRTYGQLAAAAGSPKAARAVGRCMATNPIALVIPCHRVIPSSGRLGGYSGGRGIQTKRELIDMESSAKGE